MDSISTSNHIDFKNFYTFSDPLATRPFRLVPKEQGREYSLGFLFNLAKGKNFLEEPIQFFPTKGNKATQVLWSEIVFLLCVSTKVVSLLQENKITGWSTYPAQDFDRSGILLPGYNGLSITGKECRRDRSQSTIIMKKNKLSGKPMRFYKGLYFIGSDWDGCDFFYVSSFGGIVVTKKVKELFSKANITNIEFISLPEVELSVLLDKYDKESK